MLSVIDIIYFVILVTLSYFTFFHLVLWFESKESVRRMLKNNKNLPSVSVLIPAYNEEKIIGKTLENLKTISYPKNKLEIIVIDDGSTDKTYEIAKKFKSKNIKILTKGNSGKASSLNFGLGYAKNEFVAVMDADTFLNKDALRNCMKYFDEENVAAVTSHILVKRRKTIWEKLQNIEFMIIAMMRKAQEKMNLINATPGPLSIYKKKILLEVGKFDEKNLVEDIEIAWRLLKRDYKIKMAFDAMVYSIYPDNFRNWWRQRVRWGIGGIQTFLKYFDCFLRREYHTVGEFLVPTSFMGYSFLLLGVGIFLYLSLNWLIGNVFYFANSLTLGLNPLSRMDISYIIDLRVIYGFMMLAISLYIIQLALTTHKEKPNILNLILFLAVYSVLLPLINLYSIYKYARKEGGWLTK